MTTAESVELVAFADAPAGVEWSAIHLQVLDPNLSYESFEQLVAAAGVLGDAGRWLTGDLLNFGGDRYGERYAQALEHARVGERSLRRYSYVCRQIPAHSGRRRPNLSFSHHDAVARLTPEQQTRLLDRAEQETLSAVQVEDLARDLDALGGRTRAAPRPRQEVLDAPTTVNAASDLRAVRETLTLVGTALETEEAAEALGLPRALRAVDDLGTAVHRAAATLERPSLTDAVRRVVKNATVSGGFYMVEAAVFQELAALVAAT